MHNEFWKISQQVFNSVSMNSLKVVFSPLPLSFIWLFAVFVFPSLFVDVLFVCALECAVITSLLYFWCFHVLPELSQLSSYTFDLCYIYLSYGKNLRPALEEAH